MSRIKVQPGEKFITVKTDLSHDIDINPELVIFTKEITCGAVSITEGANARLLYMSHSGNNLYGHNVVFSSLKEAKEDTIARLKKMIQYVEQWHV